ncbi:hypothetical protein NP493_233g00020 [Ridgeia piscesae]|uniref:Uncharacterized protein n=1 Tax=Ridgeia piscesae TaxID=27915 RepID=A0AAD9UDK8_RIDPI|nr:hypothetical protein NP493_233g00020 [Ridgeia piscesae]
MTIGLMTVLLRRKSMHISFVLETFKCRKSLLHQLEKRTTEERYDWYETKSHKRASMAVSSENLTNWVDESTLRVICIQGVQKWTQNTTLRHNCVANQH